MSDRMHQEGANEAPAFQREEPKAPLLPVPEASPYSFRRRDRWGKLDAIVTCEVCGRRLCVNWTRARPCLFCDDSASEAKR